MSEQKTHKTQLKKLAIYYLLCSSYCTSNFSLSSSSFENRSAENSTQISQLINEDTDDNYLSEEESEAI
jgi:hypothetical protein